MKLVYAQNQKEIFTVINIRKVVFMEEQAVDASEELDDKDYEAQHYLVSDGDTMVGTARIYFEDDVAFIGRVAVLKEHRKKGYASFIIKELIEIIKESDARVIHLGAQVQAQGFYEKLGFEVCGDLYLDANIDHYPMELVL